MMSMSKPSDSALEVLPTVLPRINLLPPEIGRRRRLRRIQQGLALAVLGAFVVVTLLFVAATGGVSSADRRLADADAQQRAVQSESSRYREVTETYKRADAEQALLATAMSQEVRYSGFLNDLALSVPPNVWVTNLAFAQSSPTTTTGAAATAAATAVAAGGLGSVTMTGVAYAHEDVAVWLESLAQEKGYAAPTLQSSTEVLLGTKKVVNWSTTVTLTPAALSGRYTSGTGG